MDWWTFGERLERREGRETRISAAALRGSTAGRALRLLRLIGALAFALWASPSSGGAARSVVLLYDERTELPGLAALDAAIDRGLTEGSKEQIEIYRVRMDLSRFDSGAYQENLSTFLRQAYANKTIDAVVAALSPSLDFALRHRDDVFHGAPIVFCGIDRRELAGRVFPPGVTGVVLKREFAPTLELALRLQPDATRVVFVAGTSDFDQSLLEMAREDLRPFENRLKVIYLTDLPFDELLVELSRLPADTIVLCSTMFRDGAGKPLVPHAVVEQVSAAASVPVYGFVDQFMGRGIVGGHLYSMNGLGAETAKLVLRVMAPGERPELPPLEPSTSVTAFDWRQLDRWGLRSDRLPPDAEVLFSPTSIWTEHWRAIVVASLILVGQSALIAALLFSRSRRRRAERKFRESELQFRSRLQSSHGRIQHLVGQLIAAQEAERARIARELHDGVNQALAALSISLSTVKRKIPRDSEELHEELTRLQEQTIDLSDEVRHISHELHSGVLQHAGLVPALRSHCAEIAAQYEMSVKFTSDDDLREVSRDVALCLYRVTQEALHNVTKHAGARNVNVSLGRENSTLELVITDDGRGFDVQDARAHTGLGLLSMEERVRLVEGTLEIESRRGAGTSLRVSVPAGSSSIA